MELPLIAEFFLDGGCSVDQDKRNDESEKVSTSQEETRT